MSGGTIRPRDGKELRQAIEWALNDGVTLDVEDAKVTVLRGPSGSGKTSLLALIGCMARPTSGRIHVGHVYSYTQADIMIRFHRMRGRNVFYPFGFDDNGLPTEVFTENNRGVRARDIGRRRRPCTSPAS